MSPLRRLDPQRLNFERNLTRAEVEELASDAALKVIQCDSPVEPPTWDLLNEILFIRRPEMTAFTLPSVYGAFTQSV